jgi:segregation and condensation protein B
MSLKAKIEAVIYASEEPVTLAQLIGLLGEEAQAEIDAFAARQQSLALEALPGSGPGQQLPGQNFQSQDFRSQNFRSQELAESDAEALNAEVLGPDAPAHTADPEAQAGEADDAAGPGEDRANVEPIDRAPAAPEPAAETSPASEKALAAAARQKERALRDYFRGLLDQLIADYAGESRGLEIREVAGGFRLATKPEYHDAVRGFVKTLKPPLKLSLQALETLAVVAYKQPVTAPEVSEIRGVDSAGVLGSLMTRKLITTAGRKQVIGRPILYKTTKDFLLRFGLRDINELPSIEEFEKMAGELNAAVQEEIPMDTQTGVSQETNSRALRESTEDSGEGASASLDELNSAPEPTHVNHDTVEDLMSDRSSSPEGHNREHADPRQVDPQYEANPESLRRAEDGDETQTCENMADEVAIDGRISGLPPSYDDDSPSAREAREQQDESN